MVKFGQSFVKIGSCLQTAPFFLFYRKFHPTPLLFDFTERSNPPAY